MTNTLRMGCGACFALLPYIQCTWWILSSSNLWGIILLLFVGCPGAAVCPSSMYCCLCGSFSIIARAFHVASNPVADVYVMFWGWICVANKPPVPLLVYESFVRLERVHIWIGSAAYMVSSADLIVLESLTAQLCPGTGFYVTCGSVLMLHSLLGDLHHVQLGAREALLRGVWQALWFPHWFGRGLQAGWAYWQSFGLFWVPCAGAWASSLRYCLIRWLVVSGVTKGAFTDTRCHHKSSWLLPSWLYFANFSTFYSTIL